MLVMYKKISFEDTVYYFIDEKNNIPLLSNPDNRLDVFKLLGNGIDFSNYYGSKNRLDIFKCITEGNDQESDNNNHETNSDLSSYNSELSTEGNPQKDMQISGLSKSDECSDSFMSVSEVKENILCMGQPSEKIKKEFTIQTLMQKVKRKWGALIGIGLTPEKVVNNINKWMEESSIIVKFNRVKSEPISYQDTDQKSRYFYITNWREPKFYTCLDTSKIPKDLGEKIEAIPKLKISKVYKYDLQFEAPYIEGANIENDKSVKQFMLQEKYEDNKKKAIGMR